jgi:hypothetical protein
MPLHQLTSVTIGVPDVGPTAGYYTEFGLRHARGLVVDDAVHVRVVLGEVARRVAVEAGDAAGSQGPVQLGPPPAAVVPAPGGPRGADDRVARAGLTQTSIAPPIATAAIVPSSHSRTQNALPMWVMPARIPASPAPVPRYMTFRTPDRSRNHVTA